MVEVLAVGPVRAHTPGAPTAREVMLASCVGGAGTTTLSRLLGRRLVRAWDMGKMITHLPDPRGRPLLMVTQGVVHGASEATTWVNRALGRGLRPAALVVVADGRGREPAPARARLRMLESLVPVVRFPHVDQWRYLDPLEKPESKKVTEALDSLMVLIGAELRKDHS